MNWQQEKPCDRATIIEDIKTGKARGYGLRTGQISDGIVAVDCDGEAAHELAKSLGGLPATVSFTSGKDGRAQYLYKISDKYWCDIKTQKLRTGKTGADGKEMLLELRWDGCQSVLPPSAHPETGQYHWIKSPQETAIADAPRWVIEKMRGTARTETPLLNSITSDDIPLTICLAKETRKLIESGSPDGQRGDDAIKVAQDLLGTYERL
ncbi:bifunctional DNA primase/polymerase, partial [Lyngbya sp. CCY1209]|uniref:bifunctional DNA primase/polymerase n=1 Tax=Lyngbya sp. CCY1209 TaxID=2886103 RepID=UPI002D1FD18E